MVAKTAHAALSLFIRPLKRNSIRFLLAISCMIYAFGLLLGFVTYALLPDDPDRQIPSPGVANILVHNLQAMAPLAGGIVTFGFSTFFCLIFNGAVAGYAVASAKTVLSWTQVGLRILPHGLFEIPAMLFWAAAGFSSCTWIYTRIRGIPLERAFWADVVALLGAGGLLLVVAAIIEGTVTYRLALIQ